MHALHRTATALMVAGRRVVQPFHARTFTVPRSTEPVSGTDAPPPHAPSVHEHHRDIPCASARRPYKKRSKTPPPFPKPKTRKAKSAPMSAGDSKHPKTIRKTKAGSATRAQKAPPEHTLGHGGFVSDSWKADWGKDELAPPPPTKRRTPKSRPKKVTVPIVSRSSSSTRAHPPHRIPYVRRTEGYISDETEQRNSVLRDVESPSEHKPIAQLAHGLDRVLFNPGVYWLRDPRSRIYNFTPWLESIPPVTDFAFERVTGFIRSSMDNDLWKIAKQYKRPFAGSTSSLTGLLSHCYFLISGDKDVDTSSLSRGFLHQPTNFTPGQRMPTSVVLNYKEGVWLIDSDKTEELAEKNVLTWMGTMLEKFLTVSEGEFKKLVRSAPVVEEDSDTRREAYRYAMSDRFVMRSQLDCVDPRLPGTGVFDIKTRAAVPIRLDILNYEENSGYLIKTLTGPLESFEKEYYDLIRSAFLKYSFQARIGNMDGVLVAYHNTARIFGFQYVSLEEMEERLYSSGNGARVFNKCVLLLERILGDVISIYGERSVRCTFETRESSQELNVWIQPVEWDEEVEGKPCPITELGIRVENHLDGEEVKGAKAVADGGEWMVHWILTESAIDEVEIRRRLESARDRQFRELNFPTGVSTIEEMKKAWAKIDFGGRQSAQAMMDVIKELESQPECVGSENGMRPELPDLDGSDTAGTASPGEAVQETHDLPQSPSPRSSPFPSPFLGFRAPDKNIRQLRQLALQGREETLREEAEGREKVVWGSVEGCREERVREEEGPVPLGWGTLPGGEADDRVEGVQVGAVGDGEGVREARSART